MTPSNFDLPEPFASGATIEDDDIVRYLLGTLPAADRDRFEALYFEDDELFERVKAVEERLIRDRLLFRLPEAEEQRFTETYVVPPSRYQRVTLAETLLDEATKELSADPQFCDSIGYLNPLGPSDRESDNKKV
ncbi:MAG: hypothetical protein K1Y36_00540 [Blastocatellia bacterium]|nr:hypothetical protein [Blastocatellia bacterium]